MGDDGTRENYLPKLLLSRQIENWLLQLVRQFDPVGVLLLAFMLIRENLLQPVCLLLSAPTIRYRRTMAYHELLAACIAPEDAHFSKIGRRLF